MPQGRVFLALGWGEMGWRAALPPGMHGERGRLGTKIQGLSSWFLTHAGSCFWVVPHSWALCPRLASPVPGERR